VLTAGHPGQRRQRFTLRAGGDEHQPIGRHHLSRPDVDHVVVRDVEIAEFFGDAHVSNHRATDEGHPPAQRHRGVDDLLDAVDWAVKGGFADPKRVAIMGGSYGGYATLAGLTFTPTTFACGVDIVGPSNLATLLSTIPAYWEAGRRQLYKRLADPTTPEGKAKLAKMSPLTHADKIVRPLLIGQGANDPRVKQAESDQIVSAMQAKGIPVTYVLFPDEGHGFARPANNIAFMAVTENFLSACIGGRAEPIGGTVAASSAKVPHGAEYAPGLKAAIASK
jgi:dienelactone hydrolase